MTTDKDELLQQARDSLAAAKLLFANEYAGYSAARSYYTMFYVVSAILYYAKIFPFQNTLRLSQALVANSLSLEKFPTIFIAT